MAENNKYSYEIVEGKVTRDMPMSDATSKAQERQLARSARFQLQSEKSTEEHYKTLLKEAKNYYKELAKAEQDAIKLHLSDQAEALNVEKNEAFTVINAIQESRNSLIEGKPISLNLDIGQDEESLNRINTALSSSLSNYKSAADEELKIRQEHDNLVTNRKKQQLALLEKMDENLYRNANIFEKKLMLDARAAAFKSEELRLSDAKKANDEKRKALNDMANDMADELEKIDAVLDTKKRAAMQAELDLRKAFINAEQAIITESNKKLKEESESVAKDKEKKLKDQQWVNDAVNKANKDAGKEKNAQKKDIGLNKANGLKGNAKAWADLGSDKSDYLKRKKETQEAAVEAEKKAAEAAENEQNVKNLKKAEYLANRYAEIDSNEDMSDVEKAAAKAKVKSDLENKDSEESKKFQEENSELFQELSDTTKDLSEKATVANQIANDAKDLGKDLLIATKKSLSALTDKVTTELTSIMGYSSAISARLQESQTSFTKALDLILDNIGLSTIVSQKKVVENLKNLVDEGIAYDVELRSFIQTVKDDIVSTFDATSDAIERIIRMQQSDSTAQRLGMEATLLKLLNSNYQNSEYLTDKFDTVESSLLDTMSKMRSNDALEFEYQVLKWLGSLYSLGLSDSAVDTIAAGINAMGTGDITYLNSNESVQTLFAMSANKAGLNYADLLLEGLNQSNINKLMNGMVNYLADIASLVEDDNVVAKAFAEVLGIGFSDLNAIKNMISSGTLGSINGNSLSYVGALSEYNSQVMGILLRKDITSLVNTLVENIVSNTAMEIGSNLGYYIPYALISEFKKFVTSGIAIPFLESAGFGVDVNTSVADLLLEGITGLGFLTSMMSNIGNMVVKGSINPGNIYGWGYKESVTRGSAFDSSNTGMQEALSKSSDMSSYTNQSSEDLEHSTLAKEAERADETSAILNANTQPSRTVEDLRDELFKKSEEPIPVSVVPADNDIITLSDLYETLFYNRLPVLTLAVSSYQSPSEYLAAKLSPYANKDATAKQLLGLNEADTLNSRDKSYEDYLTTLTFSGNDTNSLLKSVYTDAIDYLTSGWGDALAKANEESTTTILVDNVEKEVTQLEANKLAIVDNVRTFFTDVKTSDSELYESITSYWSSGYSKFFIKLILETVTGLSIGLSDINDILNSEGSEKEESSESAISQTERRLAASADAMESISNSGGSSSAGSGGSIGSSTSSGNSTTGGGSSSTESLYSTVEQIKELLSTQNESIDESSDILSNTYESVNEISKTLTALNKTLGNYTDSSTPEKIKEDLTRLTETLQQSVKESVDNLTSLDEVSTELNIVTQSVHDILTGESSSLLSDISSDIAELVSSINNVDNLLLGISEYVVKIGDGFVSSITTNNLTSDFDGAYIQKLIVTNSLITQDSFHLTESASNLIANIIAQFSDKSVLKVEVTNVVDMHLVDIPKELSDKLSIFVEEKFKLIMVKAFQEAFMANTEDSSTTQGDGLLSTLKEISDTSKYNKMTNEDILSELKDLLAKNFFM